MNKSEHWYFKIPGEVYAIDIRFKAPVSIVRAKEKIREYLKVKRLPRGIEIWVG